MLPSNGFQLTRIERADFSAHDAQTSALIAECADGYIAIDTPLGDTLASAALWWRETPALSTERVGVIGAYQDVSGAAALALLDACCEWLREQRCTVAIGPMNGCTWRNYRFVTESGTQPAFALEPSQPASWPCHWRTTGFREFESYISTVSSTDAENPAQTDRARKRLDSNGVRIRPLDTEQLDAELTGIYRVTRTAFAKNTLYTPLDEGEFKQRYRQILSVVPAEFCLVAEADDALVGYLFALPNRQPGTSSPTDTLILKTVAVLPGRQQAGLGRVLLDECMATARERGYRQAIQALMHVRNSSSNIVKQSSVIRRYGLFARSLA